MSAPLAQPLNGSRITAAATVAALLLGCSVRPPSGAEKNLEIMRSTIEEALRRLLNRSNEDTFVIFSRASGKEYIQFALDDQGLFLDLPVIPLDNLQRARAKAFFDRLGVSLASTLLHDPGGLPAGSLQFYRVDFGQDVQQAASTAVGVFREVYALDDFQLEVEEN